MESTAAEKSTCESTSAEEDLTWDTPLAYEPRIEETSNEIESVQKKSCCDQNHGNHNHKLSRDSYFPPESPLKQSDPAKREPHVRNGQRRTRRSLHGECYVGLSLPQQQKCHPPLMAGFGTRAIFLDSRNGSTSTGIFLPRTAGNPSEPPQGKPSTINCLVTMIGIVKLTIFP